MLQTAGVDADADADAKANANTDSNANANAPKGAIETDQVRYQIYTNDNARTAEPYRNLIIANRNGPCDMDFSRCQEFQTAPPKT